MSPENPFIGASETSPEEKRPVFQEIPLERIPEQIGAYWKQIGSLPESENGDWRSAFTEAYLLSPDSSHPHEQIFALVNRRNGAEPESISFAALESLEMTNQALLIFSPPNREADNDKPPLYTDEPLAWGMRTMDGKEGKGIGSRVLTMMNAFSVARYGKPLTSDIEKWNKGPWGDGGWRTWESLERKGLVKKYDTPHGARFVFVEDVDS